MVTFVVEAYLCDSGRLLWRATETDRRAAQRLAVRADSDPRIDVRVVEERAEEATAAADPVVDLTGDPAGRDENVVRLPTRTV